MAKEKVKEEIDFDLDLYVDQNKLPEQWAEQPALMLKYSKLLAEAEYEVDMAKAKLAVVSAEVESDVRNNPEDHGISKLTEATVAAAIPQTIEHDRATKAYNKAKHESRMLRAAVDALGHRKSALQGITDLYMRQWFADPSSARNGDDGPSKAATISRRVPRRGVKD